MESHVASKKNNTAVKRFQQDYIRLKKDPVPYVTAEPLPNNLYVWHYVIEGPDNSEYHDGYYHGKLVFPKEYPFRPPAIYMITPNGRFQVNTKLCLSISDFHPDSWNPAWSVSSILTGLLSFMLEDTITTGSIKTSKSTKRKLAYSSIDFNLQDNTFCNLFPELVEKHKKQLELREENSNGNPVCQNSNNLSSNEHNAGARNDVSAKFVLIILLLFAVIVKFVMSYLTDSV